MGYFLAGNCGHVLNSLPDYILVDSNTSIKSFEVRESVCLSSGLFTSSRPKAACRCDMAMLSTCCPWHFNQEPLHVSILCGVIFCEQYSTYCGKPDSSKLRGVCANLRAIDRSSVVSAPCVANFSRHMKWSASYVAASV